MAEEQVATPSQQPHLRGSGLRDPLLFASCGTEKAELGMKSNQTDIKPLTTYTLSTLTLHQPVPTEGQVERAPGWGSVDLMLVQPCCPPAGYLFVPQFPCMKMEIMVYSSFSWAEIKKS